ncbi:MAG: hypothetical protein KJ000_27725 [Pirellulaceae bacterium]|jgi:F0F1-type ATP synthase assembly protein I|nr:hypothetical protein [Pirellulaceae bacterium]
MAGKRLQFDLRALLCGMVVISLGLAYLRTLNPAHPALGLAAAFGALLLGTLVGLVTGRLADAQFWSVLGSTFALISAIEIVPYHWAWAVTGAAAGAAVGCTAGGSWLRTILAGGLSATAAFGIYVAVFYATSPREILFDLAAVPVVGVFFGWLVDIFFRLEQRTSLPRHVTATVLMIAVCVGNHFAR